MSAAASLPFAAQALLHRPSIAYLAILPDLIMLGGALLTLVISSVSRRAMDTMASVSLAVGTAAATLVAGLLQWVNISDSGPHVTIAGAVVEDGFSVFVTVLVSSAVLLTALVGQGWMQRERSEGPELLVLLMVSALGAILMGQAGDLIMVFLGLETLSIALYVLAASNARRSESAEAGLKYFVLGSFSSAVFLYGIALVYGATGSTNLGQIADYLSRNVLLHNGGLLAGLALLLVGFGFKVAAVPFHLWTPDVYQGSPSPVTGFMAAVAKTGGFAALLRVLISSFPTLRDDWQPLVWVLAGLSLLLGAVVAVVQRDVKRMLAYSSINHAGFILLGVQAATAAGVAASLYYLFVYSLMVVGSFAVVTYIGGRGDAGHDLERYRGLAQRQPWLFVGFTILLLGQAGIPFTTGFYAKLRVVLAVTGTAPGVVLAVIAMMTAVVALFFYLRIVVVMVNPQTPEGDEEPVQEGVPVLVPAMSGVSTGAADLGGEVLRSTAAVGPDLAGPAAVGVAEVGGAPRGDELDEVAGPAGSAGSAGSEDGLDRMPLAIASVVAVCAGATVFFGIWAGPLLDFAKAAKLLF